jgi:hypothetical protein
MGANNTVPRIFLWKSSWPCKNAYHPHPKVSRYALWMEMGGAIPEATPVRSGGRRNRRAGTHAELGWESRSDSPPSDAFCSTLEIAEGGFLNNIKTH